MSEKRLPIGFQTLSKILSDNYYYVDKTRFVEMIARRGGFYFLSRPRRFGKSLFLDTLAEALSGNGDLFKGLYLYDKYDFTPYPVIRLSFGSGDYKKLQEELATAFTIMFTENYRRLKLPMPDPASFQNPKLALTNLILAASERYQAPVAVLIDEYDKPILDNLSRPEVAREARDILKNLYSVLKDSDRYLRLAFI
ncbi:MAG: AAA family ATPase, partial [Breznakiellaceae bacterium]